jgi:hypothetical protein
VCLMTPALRHQRELRGHRVGAHMLHGCALSILLAWGAPSTSHCLYLPNSCNALLVSVLGGTMWRTVLVA